MSWGGGGGGGTVLGGVYKNVLGGGVEWLCDCPRGCLKKVSWGGLSGYATVLGGVGG